MQRIVSVNDFNELFDALDDLDKGIALGVMVDLLRNEKYSKRIDYKQQGNIISLSFNKGMKNEQDVHSRLPHNIL